MVNSFGLSNPSQVASTAPDKKFKFKDCHVAEEDDLFVGVDKQWQRACFVLRAWGTRFA